jgi:acyl carrier protein
VDDQRLIKKKVKEIISKSLGIHEKETSFNLPFSEISDGLEFPEMIMDLEDEFSLIITDSEANSIVDCENAQKFICEKMVVNY